MIESYSNLSVIVKNIYSCLVRIQFEGTTDNEVLRYHSNKISPTTRVIKWFEKREMFGILPVNLNPRRIHVFTDAIYRIPNDKAVSNDVKELYIKFSEFIYCYED